MCLSIRSWVSGASQTAKEQTKSTLHKLEIHNTHTLSFSYMTILAVAAALFRHLHNAIYGALDDNVADRRCVRPRMCMYASGYKHNTFSFASVCSCVVYDRLCCVGVAAWGPPHSAARTTTKSLDILATIPKILAAGAIVVMLF